VECIINYDCNDKDCQVIKQKVFCYIILHITMPVYKQICVIFKIPGGVTTRLAALEGGRRYRAGNAVVGNHRGRLQPQLAGSHR